MTTNAQELAEIRERMAAWEDLASDDELNGECVKCHCLIARPEPPDERSPLCSACILSMLDSALAIVDRQSGEIAEQTTRANNYEQSSQEHAQRAEELAAKLECVEKFARTMRNKGSACRKMAGAHKVGTEDHRRLIGKASTYEAEARSLRQILESK